MDVFPDFGATASAADLPQVIGALLMFVLVIAVLMLVVCAITWAPAGPTPGAPAAPQGTNKPATRARPGLLVAIGTAVLAGAGVAWLNWLITLGSGL